MSDEHAYKFSRVAVEGAKRITAVGTEYYAAASQLIAIPGKNDTYQLLEFTEEKTQGYKPQEGERIKMPLWRVKLQDIWGQFVEGIPKSEVEEKMATYGLPESRLTPA